MAFRAVHTDLEKEKRKAIFHDIVKDVIKSFADGLDQNLKDEKVIPKGKLFMAIILSGIKPEKKVADEVLFAQGVDSLISLTKLQELLEKFGALMEYVPRDRVIPLRKEDFGDYENEKINLFSVGPKTVQLSLKEWVEEMDQTCVLKEMSQGDKFFQLSQ
jgi:hypothetical protein